MRLYHLCIVGICVPTLTSPACVDVKPPVTAVVPSSVAAAPASETSSQLSDQASSNPPEEEADETERTIRDRPLPFDLHIEAVRNALTSDDDEIDFSRPFPLDKLEDLSRFGDPDAERRPLDEALYIESQKRDRRYADFLRANPDITLDEAARAKMAIIVEGAQ